MSIKLITPKFRLSFPCLFEARAAPDSKKAFFSAVALFDKEEIQGDPEQKALFMALKKAIKAAAEEKWGTGFTDYKKPWREGSDKKDIEGYGEEVIFINMKSKHRPGVVDQNVQDIMAEGDIYAGCYCRAEVNVYAWTHPMTGKGVSFGLQNIQKMDDGEPLGGGRGNPQDAFSAIDGASVTEDDNDGSMFE